MSFFDDIGTKITQTGQKAKKTANDLVGAAKLSSQVTEQTKAIQALYEKLGECYYQRYGQQPQPAEELQELCSHIKASQDELSNMQAELQRLKNVKVCPQCGHGNTAEAKFCGQCSAPLPELPAREPKEAVCPSCGAKLNPGASFCTKCGTKV